MRFSHRASLFGACSIFLSSVAFGHVTLDGGEVLSGSYYKAVFTVPHGCEGSPTVRIRVRIPDGVTSVKPQARAGWKLATVKSKLATPIDNGHGGKITEGVTEVSWSGGPLPDDQFEEFKIQMKLPEINTQTSTDATLYFPVVQECAKGVTRWIEVPKAGRSSHDYRAPAPALKLRAK